MRTVLSSIIGVSIYRYHLKDVIIGKIYFLLVRIKIKNMDLEIRRRESTGSGPNTHVETETLAKFELMDGAPVRGMFTTVLLPCIFWILLEHTTGRRVPQHNNVCMFRKYMTIETFDQIFIFNWDDQVIAVARKNSKSWSTFCWRLSIAHAWMAYMHMLAFSGESIPIRLFLSPYELTPTHRNINNKFSVKYYLNLVLVDEEDRRYFKQQEITIYRLQETWWSLISYSIPNWFG